MGRWDWIERSGEGMVSVRNLGRSVLNIEEVE